MDTHHPVALITGGGSGIGAATARRLARDGYRVAVTGRRRHPLEAVAATVDGLAIVADTSVETDCRRAVELTMERFGRLDALVANAGIEAMGSAADLDLDDWHRVMRVNVDGALLAVRSATEALRATRGSIVVVSSVAGLTAGPSYTAYVTSKTAVLGLVRSLAVDLGPHGVRANAICPGWVATEMSRREVTALAENSGLTDDEARHRLVEYLPLGRMAEPEEIAGAIAFLAGPDSSFVTGTTLVADGGGSAVDVGTLAYREMP
ncbi:MAG TPA: SDR family oxidoreductase [Acidimicrobiales bacterium]|nr:SDR family oxidoreductase [Acidimicrobiales bacterium]